uniref:Uncharacterized protein n=1 Tax=Trichobilharzia regenti TaxID=157069 RepID=A0AA85J8S8_TRIRE|nr:unnamed protein product [Trichobilharzia regenti]
MSFPTPSNYIHCETQKEKSRRQQSTDQSVANYVDNSNSPSTPLRSSNITTTSSSISSCSSSSPSSTISVSNITDLCAWCQKPNLHPYKFNVLCKSVNVDNSMDETRPMPVCCSQICFDNLRRAYFKNRRSKLNRQLFDEIPAMVVSGRLPYTYDSDKDITVVSESCKQAYLSTNLTVTNSNSRIPSKKRCHHHQQQNNIQNRRHIMNNLSSRINFSTNTQNNYLSLAEQVSDSTHQNNTEPSIIPLYDCIMQHIDITHVLNNLFNTMSIENNNTDNHCHYNNCNTKNTDISKHNSDLSIMNAQAGGIGQLNSSNMELINFISQLVNFPNKNITNNDTSSDGSNINKNLDFQFNCFNQQPIVPIPIPIPVFKTAPELLTILHRYGYHSLGSCEKSNKSISVDVSTQTIPQPLSKTITIAQVNSEDNLNEKLPYPLQDDVNDATGDTEQNQDKYIKTEYNYQLNENSDKALDLSLSNKKLQKITSNRNLMSMQYSENRKQCHKQQRIQNKSQLWRRRQLKQFPFTGIYNLINPVTKHCYTVKIIPIRR